MKKNINIYAWLLALCLINTEIMFAPEEGPVEPHGSSEGESFKEKEEQAKKDAQDTQDKIDKLNQEKAAKEEADNAEKDKLRKDLDLLKKNKPGSNAYKTAQVNIREKLGLSADAKIPQDAMGDLRKMQTDAQAKLDRQIQDLKTQLDNIKQAQDNLANSFSKEISTGNQGAESSTSDATNVLEKIDTIETMVEDIKPTDESSLDNAKTDIEKSLNSLPQDSDIENLLTEVKEAKTADDLKKAIDDAKTKYEKKRANEERIKAQDKAKKEASAKQHARDQELKETRSKRLQDYNDRILKEAKAVQEANKQAKKMRDLDKVSDRLLNKSTDLESTKNEINNEITTIISDADTAAKLQEEVKGADSVEQVRNILQEADKNAQTNLEDAQNDLTQTQGQQAVDQAEEITDDWVNISDDETFDIIDPKEVQKLDEAAKAINTTSLTDALNNMVKTLKDLFDSIMTNLTFQSNRMKTAASDAFDSVIDQIKSWMSSDANPQDKLNAANNILESVNNISKETVARKAQNAAEDALNNIELQEKTNTSLDSIKTEISKQLEQNLPKGEDKETVLENIKNATTVEEVKDAITEVNTNAQEAVVEAQDDQMMHDANQVAEGLSNIPNLDPADTSLTQAQSDVTTALDLLPDDSITKTLKSDISSAKTVTDVNTALNKAQTKAEQVRTKFEKDRANRDRIRQNEAKRKQASKDASDQAKAKKEATAKAKNEAENAKRAQDAANSKAETKARKDAKTNPNS